MKHEDELALFLSHHSNSGTWALLEAARHFFITRATYERLTADGIGESRYYQLAEEAWSIFVSSSIYSYDTWLAEVIDMPDPEELKHRSETIQALVDRLRGDWISWAISVKADILL